MGKKEEKKVDLALGASAQRNYKDSVFRMPYRDKSKLLELYNAINDTKYTDPEKPEAVERAVAECIKEGKGAVTLNNQRGSPA